MVDTPTRSLLASTNPQARMQELLRQDAHPTIHTEENTEKITEAHTEKNTPSHAEAKTDTLPPTQKRARKAVQQDVQPELLAASSTVRQRIVEDLQKEPVVRKTIDLPASLNERLQDYCAAKRIKTERRVFLVLLENFLEEEGY